MISSLPQYTLLLVLLYAHLVVEIALEELEDGCARKVDDCCDGEEWKCEDYEDLGTYCLHRL